MLSRGFRSGAHSRITDAALRVFHATVTDCPWSITFGVTVNETISGELTGPPHVSRPRITPSVIAKAGSRKSAKTNMRFMPPLSALSPPPHTF